MWVTIRSEGVFTEVGFGEEALVIHCPLFVFEKRECAHVLNTALAFHIFNVEREVVALPMGAAAFLNHSTMPSARIELDLPNSMCYVYARHVLGEGQEVTVDHNKIKLLRGANSE